MKSTNLTPERLICIFHYIITFPPFHTTIRLKSSEKLHLAIYKYLYDFLI